MPTHKNLQLVEMNLREMSHLQLGHFLIELADAFDVHPGYQGADAFPPPLPKPAEVRKAGVNRLVLTKAAEGRDRYKVAERDASRPSTEMLPTILVQWAVIRSVREGDATLIGGLGLQPKMQTAKGVVPACVTVPENVKAKHSDVPGAVYIATGKVPKSRTYEVGYCQGDPSQEGSW